MHAVPGDFINGAIGLFDRVSDGCAASGDAQNAPATGKPAAVVLGCARMKNETVVPVLKLFQAGDLFSSIIGPRIAVGAQHHANGGVFMPFGFDLAEISVNGRLEQGDQDRF